MTQPKKDNERANFAGGYRSSMWSRVYYQIRSAMRDPWKMTTEGEREALRTWLCKGCRTPKPDAGPIDVTVQFGPGNEPLKLIPQGNLGLVRRDLMSALGEDVLREHLHLGKVYGEDGRQLTKWATFHARRRLIVRGSGNARYRRCEECGQVRYYAEGKKYLYPPPPCVTLFGGGGSRLVLTKDLFVQSRINRWRGKLEVCKLVLPDAPLDGLGELSA